MMYRATLLAALCATLASCTATGGRFASLSDLQEEFRDEPLFTDARIEELARLQPQLRAPVSYTHLTLPTIYSV